MRIQLFEISNNSLRWTNHYNLCAIIEPATSLVSLVVSPVIFSGNLSSTNRLRKLNYPAEAPCQPILFIHRFFDIKDIILLLKLISNDRNQKTSNQNDQIISYSIEGITFLSILLLCLSRLCI